MVATLNLGAFQLTVSELQTTVAIVRALDECSPELQVSAQELMRDLASGELDDYEMISSSALLAEILFPNADPDDKLPGLDCEKVEQIAPSQNPEAQAVLARMDAQEATFAQRLGHWMTVRGVTQSELAEKVGIGQPAVSMFLKRTSRPQLKTVNKFATALGVSVEELWPTGATMNELPTDTTASTPFLEELPTVLSNRERDRFLELLANPPAPNAALKAAAARHLSRHA